MAVYSASQIYRFALDAGFSPDQAVTMTAIALAESSGNSDARNDSGEHSQGLWQINRDAHDSWLGDRNLFDPAVNAAAAWEVSRHGATLEPWTVTHRGSLARYLQFREEAQQAAVANGDPPNLGVWTGTEGYGHDVSTGAPDVSTGAPGDSTGAPGDGVDPPSNDTAVPATPIGGSKVDEFVNAALAQTGDEYVFGYEIEDLGDLNPTVFDCSELVEWAAHQAGVEVPDGAMYQYLDLKDAGDTISVEQAIRTRGALLFSFSEEPTPGGGRPEQAHVAISLGNGQTIEARGSSYGVGSWEANSERFNYAAVIPELGSPSGATTTTTPVETAPGPPDEPTAAPDDGTDADVDGLTAKLERILGTDPARQDTDDDGITDFYEISRLKTNPRSADTDRDGSADGIELASGTNPHGSEPTDPDAATTPPGIDPDEPDTDGDRLSDRLEALLRTDPHSVDTDSDGYVDGWEFSSGTDAIDPMAFPSTPIGSAEPTTPALTPDPLEDASADAGTHS